MVFWFPVAHQSNECRLLLECRFLLGGEVAVCDLVIDSCEVCRHLPRRKVPRLFQYRKEVLDFRANAFWFFTGLCLLGFGAFKDAVEFLVVLLVEVAFQLGVHHLDSFYEEVGKCLLATANLGEGGEPANFPDDIFGKHFEQPVEFGNCLGEFLVFHLLPVDRIGCDTARLGDLGDLAFLGGDLLLYLLLPLGVFFADSFFENLGAILCIRL